MRPNTKASVAMVICAGALAVGCGDSSPESQISSTFSDAASALTNGDGKKFCESLTPAARSKFESQISAQTGGAGCAAGVSKLIGAVKAIDSSDWQKFCDSISPDAAKALGKAGAGQGLGGDGSCASGAKAVEKTAAGKQVFASLRQQLSATFDRLKNAKLVNIKITGNTATAQFEGAKAGEKAIQFEKVDGSWKLNQ